MNKRFGKFSRRELLKILAIVALSDGHISKAKGRARSLRLVTGIGGEDQHQFFRELIKEVFEKDTVHRKIKRNQLPYLLSDFNSIQKIQELYSLSPQFKTTPDKQSVEDFLSSSQPTITFLNNTSEELRWFCLRTYFDFDGSISPSVKLKRKVDKKNQKNYHYYQVQLEIEIKISETNPSLVGELIQLCKDLGLVARITKDQRNWSKIAGICISHQKSVLNFLKQGGPVTEVVISSKSKNFRGKSKKELCQKLLRIISKNSNVFSKSFSSIEEAKKYKQKIKDLIQGTF